MIKTACFIVCLLVLIDTGYAIVCYVCKATSSSACSKDKAQLREIDCGLENPRFIRFCLYKEVYEKSTGITTYSHNCSLIGSPAIFRNMPQCTYNESEYRVKACRPCFRDLCSFEGAAPAISTNPATFLCVPVMYLLNKALY